MVFGRNKKQKEEEKAEQQAEERVKAIVEEIDRTSPGNLRAMMFTPAREESELKQIAGILLHSDKHNYTKARVPSAFNMTHHDQTGLWASGQYTNLVEYAAPNPEAPFENSFPDLYRINSISLTGLSREEYRDTVKNNAGVLISDMSDQKKRVKEGSGH